MAIQIWPPLFLIMAQKFRWCHKFPLPPRTPGAPGTGGHGCLPRGTRVGIHQKPAPRIGVQQQVKTKPLLHWQSPLALVAAKPQLLPLVVIFITPLAAPISNIKITALKKAPERGRHQGDTDGCTRAMRGASRDPGGPSLSRAPPPPVSCLLLAPHQLSQRTCFSTQVLCGSHRSVGMEGDGPSDSTGRLCLPRRGHQRPRKPHPPREALPATGALTR
jgi:hypothetical protein